MTRPKCGYLRFPADSAIPAQPFVVGTYLQSAVIRGVSLAFHTRRNYSNLPLKRRQKPVRASVANYISIPGRGPSSVNSGESIRFRYWRSGASIDEMSVRLSSFRYRIPPRSVGTFVSASRITSELARPFAPAKYPPRTRRYLSSKLSFASGRKFIVRHEQEYPAVGEAFGVLNRFRSCRPGESRANQRPEAPAFQKGISR